MYGQMTAGSWIYIGTQGILQGTYETFAGVARKRFGGSLAGRLVVTAGLGGMGGAQPLAVTMNGGCALCVEVDLQRIERRIETRLPRRARRPRSTTRSRGSRRRRRERPRALDRPARQRRRGAARARAPRRARRRRDGPDERARPAQRLRPGRAHRRAGRRRCARSDPDDYLRARRRVRARARRRDPRARPRAAPRRSTTATRCAASRPSTATPTRSPTPASCPPTSGRCSARARARSAGWRCRATRPTSHATDAAILDLFGDQEHIRRWIELAAERVRVPGPAGADLLARLRRAPRRRPALQRDGRLGRAEGARSSSAATTSTRGRSPRRSARRRRCATARTRSPTGRSSTRSSTRRRARAGCRSTTAAASAWASRSTPGRSSSPTGRMPPASACGATLIADPGMGVVRHVDAGYPEAIEAAERLGVRIPMLGDDGRDGRRAVRSVCLRGAAQVLRPPEDGLPLLRHDRAARAALEGGDVVLGDGRIAGFEADATADLQVDASGCAVLPGLRRLPHAPAVRRLARGGVRAEGHRRPVRGDRPRGRRHRGVGARARRGRRRRRCSRRPRRWPPRCSRTARRRSRARAATGSRATASCGRRGWAASWPRAWSQPMAMTGAARPRRARRARPRTPGWTRSRRSPATCDGDALDIFVESVAFAQRAPRAAWARSRASTGSALRAHVEQFAANRSVPVALEAGARSVDHLSCLHPDDVGAARRRRVRGRPAAGRRADGRRAHRRPARDARRRGRDLRAGHGRQPRHLADRLDAADRRPRRAALRLERARGAARRDAQRRLGAAAGRTRSARSRSASAATCSLLDGPVEHVPYRFGHNPVAAVLPAASWCGCAPDQAWRIAR